jgi:hypothetical protein
MAIFATKQKKKYDKIRDSDKEIAEEVKYKKLRFIFTLCDNFAAQCIFKYRNTLYKQLFIGVLKTFTELSAGDICFEIVIYVSYNVLCFTAFEFVDI